MGLVAIVGLVSIVAKIVLASLLQRESPGPAKVFIVWLTANVAWAVERTAVRLNDMVFLEATVMPPECTASIAEGTSGIKVSLLDILRVSVEIGRSDVGNMVHRICCFMVSKLGSTMMLYFGGDDESR